MNGMLSFLLLALLGAAQETPAVASSPDSLKDLRVGDRIEVTLKNESVIRGTIDFLTDTHLGVDISLEAVNLNGILTLKVADVETAAKLRKISRDDAEKMLALKKADAERLAAESRRQEEELKKRAEAEVKAQEDELLKTLKVEEKSKADEVMEKMARLSEGLALLKKFPPDAGWGDEKLAALKAQFLKTKVPLAEDERNFVNNFSLWKEAKAYVEKETRAATPTEQPTETKKTPEETETKTP